MDTKPLAPVLDALFAELTQGVPRPGEAYVLNTGDVGLLRSLDKLDADAASQSVNGGATIAAHALHLGYGLSLMNRWVREGGDPFANALWDEAWKTSRVDAARWQTIRDDLRREIADWSEALRRPRDVTDIELRGLLGSIAHLAYHLGAIRQIAKSARGPKEGTFSTTSTG